MTCTTACNKLKRKMPFAWDLNIFRGCEHGCKYCYAMYSHDYLKSEEFFQDIYNKTNIVDILEQQLSSPSWKREVVNIGGVTDSYQPMEAKYKFMPEILKLMIKCELRPLIEVGASCFNDLVTYYLHRLKFGLFQSYS